jgi:Ca2+/Na+ antiporter
VVDAIGKRTKFSGALVAGTVVAFISSLPEFTMSLTNIITGKGGDGYPIAAGNLMGGNIFRTMILAVCLLIFIYTIKKAKTKSNQIFLIGMQTIVCICFFITVFFSDQMSSISPLLFLIPDIFAILAYIANIIFMIKTDKNSEQGKQLVLRRHVKQMFILESLFLIRVWLMKTKIKNVFITFGFVSLSIVLCSFTLGLNMDYIIGTINSLGDKGNKAFLASLLGGIVTSIPEIVTVLTLLKIGDSEAAITDILGSNIFSCFILGFNDLVT